MIKIKFSIEPLLMGVDSQKTVPQRNIYIFFLQKALTRSMSEKPNM